MFDLIPAQPKGALGAFSFHDFAPDLESFRDGLLAGLSKRDKAIPYWFLYDAAGSALFERICETPEYYPTRTEMGILDACAADIAALAGPNAQLIELGSGAGRKVSTLLAAMQAPAGYVAIDISRDALEAAAARIAAAHPSLRVDAICADYTQSFTLPPRAAGRRVGFFPGSTIGNMQPDEARDFLSGWVERLGPGGAMIVGVDLKKDSAILDAAYDDAAGVTAAFSKNLLTRANRELGADFDLDRFAHEAIYSPARGRVEIHLVSLAEQTARVGDRAFAFKQGERIHIEYSYKYDIAEFAALARAAGFTPRAVWTDPARLFSVHYLSLD